MMRKKHLKAALAEAEHKIENLTGEAEILYEANRKLQTRVNELRQANHSLVDAANRQVASNSVLRSENADLRSQLDTARRSFGEAFVKGTLAPVGPSRPNRKKLTEREVRDIREAYRGGMKQKDLADNYGVNPATISRTVRGIYH
ncbi:helix-turn-helix DNA-binding domain protein [Mycobacterium phage AN9]|nr:helix-turn-helix DNA-binding domain protein [Mycobacterium phage ANI8]QJD52605.1 helix-turn-helix DNA-binding domain protein [Mycobacterium phage AN9]BBC43606.1 putative HTH DNA binding protein [Mycobacterium phage C3]